MRQRAWSDFCIRQYRLEAAENANNSLLLALRTLVQALEQISGFEGAELGQDANNELVFIFRERWSSAVEHSAGAKLLPKELFMVWKSSLAVSPSAPDLISISL